MNKDTDTSAARKFVPEIVIKWNCHDNIHCDFFDTQFNTTYSNMHFIIYISYKQQQQYIQTCIHLEQHLIILQSYNF